MSVERLSYILLTTDISLIENNYENLPHQVVPNHEILGPGSWTNWIAHTCNAYVIYVRPFVGHNSIVWLPCTIKDTETIECVQRRFTKHLRRYSGYWYLEKLRRLELQSLEHIRILFDLIFCYKLYLILLICQLTISSHLALGHKYKLYKN